MAGFIQIVFGQHCVVLPGAASSGAVVTVHEHFSDTAAAPSGGAAPTNLVVEKQPEPNHTGTLETDISCSGPTASSKPAPAEEHAGLDPAEEGGVEEALAQEALEQFFDDTASAHSAESASATSDSDNSAARVSFGQRVGERLLEGLRDGPKDQVHSTGGKAYLLQGQGRGGHGRLVSRESESEGGDFFIGTPESVAPLQLAIAPFLAEPANLPHHARPPDLQQEIQAQWLGDQLNDVLAKAAAIAADTGGIS